MQTIRSFSVMSVRANFTYLVPLLSYISQHEPASCDKTNFRLISFGIHEIVCIAPDGCGL